MYEIDSRVTSMYSKLDQLDTKGKSEATDLQQLQLEPLPGVTDKRRDLTKMIACLKEENNPSLRTQ